MDIISKIKSRYVIELVFFILFLLTAGVINLQFLGGANLNTIVSGHDEYLTVREVYSILEPISLKHFIFGILHGDFLAYGSIMFYFDALISYIPYKLWGVDGMVYTIRMVHSFFVIASLCLWSITFIKNKTAKMLFFLTVLGLANTYYFAMLPKPEPMQLFFMAIFFYFFKKKDWQFGKHFVWLGLAFGLKITIIIFLPFLFLFPLLVHHEKNLKTNIIQGLWSGLYFAIGLLIAVPYLLLSPVKPHYLQSYLDANFGQSEKSYDDTSITATDWIEQCISQYYFGVDHIGWLFIIALVAILAYYLVRSQKEKSLQGDGLIGFFALLFIMTIAFKVDRVWMHYMWMGLVLGLLALHSAQSTMKDGWLKKILLGINIVLALVVGYRFVNFTIPSYFMADHDETIQQRIRASQSAFDYIEKTYPEGISIGTDGTIYYPYSQFVVAHPYHPFQPPLPDDHQTDYFWYMSEQETMWQEDNDILMFGDRHPVFDKEAIHHSYPHWDVDKNEDLFNQHMRTDFALDTIIGGIEIYKKRKLTK